MSTLNPELLTLKVDAWGAWQPGQTVKTSGTRLAWDCLAGWVRAWETLQRRRVSSTRYQQESDHIRVLPLEMIAEEANPDVLYIFLEIMASDSGNRPRKGARLVPARQGHGHPTTEMVVVANNRLAQVRALPYREHRRRQGLRRTLLRAVLSRAELARERRAEVAAPHLSLFRNLSADIPMITHFSPVSADELPRLLFQLSTLTNEGDDVEQAIATAGGRWPVLQPSLEGAAQLVRAHDLYETPREAVELALVRLPTEWRFRAVSPTPMGLACTCDGWPPVTRAGPGDGLYCPDILAYLLALYLQRPFSPLPCVPEELWRVALEELRLQMTKATFNQWLLGSAVVPEASTPLSLTVAVRNRYAQEWLTHRLHNVIVRTLGAVAGYRVQVQFVAL
jgi:hypothetical protein